MRAFSLLCIGLARSVAQERLEYRASELKYASHHMFVNHEHKLLYCAVPKVACTEFMKLFFRLSDDRTDRWRGDPHFRPDKPLFSKLTPELATAIMNDPDWTKFVFFRDPAERLLSAFIDKFENGAKYGHRYSVGLFGGRKDMSFEEFVDAVTTTSFRVRRSEIKGLHLWTNPHWRSQRLMCNIEKFLPLYNFVGSFSQLRNHTEILLRSAGLWERYGKSGWGRPTRGRAKRPRPPARNTAESLTFDAVAGGAMFERNTAWHRAPQSREGSEAKQYWTPELLSRVRAAYKMDFDMFDAINFTFDGPPVTDTSRWRTAKKDDYLCHGSREFFPCSPAAR